MGLIFFQRMRQKWTIPCSTWIDVKSFMACVDCNGSGGPPVGLGTNLAGNLTTLEEFTSNSILWFTFRGKDFHQLVIRCNCLPACLVSFSFWCCFLFFLGGRVVECESVGMQVPRSANLLLVPPSIHHQEPSEREKGDPQRQVHGKRNGHKVGAQE